MIVSAPGAAALHPGAHDHGSFGALSSASLPEMRSADAFSLGPARARHALCSALRPAAASVAEATTFPTIAADTAGTHVLGW